MGTNEKPIHYIDISTPVTENIPTWPDSIKFQHKWIKTIKEDGVNESYMIMNMHTGSHIDAPYHFLENGKRVKAISLNNLIGNVEILEYHENAHIAVRFFEESYKKKNCKRILIKTKNSKEKYNKYEFNPNYIALTEDSAEWLVRNEIKLVGIDGPSIEGFNEKDNNVHRILMESEIIILEGLDLSEVEPGNYKLIALPLNIPNAEGCPVRAVLEKLGDF